MGKHISHIGANQNESDPQLWEIVGVVGDIHHFNLAWPATPELHLPFQQNTWSWGNFLVRMRTAPPPLMTSFTETIRDGDKTALVVGVTLLTQAISSTFAQTRFFTFLFAVFGVAGLVLTLTGIYSVIAQTVAQSTQEIGVRMALGAQRTDVMKLFLARGMLLTLAGILLGAGVAAVLTRLMVSLLFGVGSTDALTFLQIAFLMAIAALLACYVPARRATAVDPMVALHYE